MKMHVGLSAVILGSLLAARPAQALEPFALYDQFSTTPLSPTKWREAERARVIKAGMLNTVQRDWGLTSSNAGVVATSWNTEVARPGRITQFRTKILVNAYEVTGCAANSAVSEVRARSIEVFFNTGNPTSGSLLGDVLVQGELSRSANSVDAPGLLRALGVVAICTASDCSTSTLLAPAVDLGTVPVGTAAEISVEWNKALKKFVFMRDGGAQTGELSYTVSDVADPGRPLTVLGSRTSVANCATGPQATGFIDASFDNVFVNRNAKP